MLPHDNKFESSLIKIQTDNFKYCLHIYILWRNTNILKIITSLSLLYFSRRDIWKYGNKYLLLGRILDFIFVCVNKSGIFFTLFFEIQQRVHAISILPYILMFVLNKLSRLFNFYEVVQVNDKN